MKKITLMVMDKNKDASLEKLRSLGLLHLERREVQSEKLNSLLEAKNKYDQAKGVLTSYAPKKAKKIAGEQDVAAVNDLSDHVLSLANQKKLALDKILNNAKEISRIEKWGNFEPDTFKYFKNNNVTLIPYELTKKAYTELGDNPVVVLSKDKTTVRCVSVGAALEGETPFALPEHSLNVIKKEQNILHEEINNIEKTLTSLYPQINSVTKDLAVIKQDIEFETAKCTMETMDEAPKELTVSWITGFVPDEDLGHIKRSAAENGWALVADDPDDTDEEVPTKLKNNKLVSLIYPLTGFLETVPGYRETDISGVFLLFFCVFFGMLFGDAGYGLLLMLAGIIGAAKTAKKGVPAAFKFLLLLATANTAWGVLTCTWFGIDVAVLPQILKDISFMPISNVSAALPSITCPKIGTGEALTLSGADYTSQNLQVFCFSLALIQLTFAHIKGFLGAIRAKSLKFLAEIGSIAMLWGMFALILYLVVSSLRFPFLEPQFLKLVLGLIGGGFAANFIFAGYEGSIIGSMVNSLKNIITVVLGLTNVFSDIMSYIRLWAVGLAGASISATVNGMAAQIFDASSAPIAGKFVIFMGILLVVFGHSLNMVLNTLSVLVHGVRLNTLEFSGHIGLTWSGIAYKPFAKR